MSETNLTSLKAILISLVVSCPIKVDLRFLIREYHIVFGVPLPIHNFGYSDPLTFFLELCSDCFKFQGDPSNPVLTATKILKYTHRRVHNRKVAKNATGRMASVPDTDDDLSTEDEAGNSDSESGRSSSSNISNCEQQQPTALQEPRDNEQQSASTSTSQRNNKRTPLEDLKDEIHAVIKDSRDGVWCKDLEMRYQERYGSPPELTRFGYTNIVSLVQTLSGRLRITRYGPSGDMLLQDAAATPPSSETTTSAAGPERRGRDFDPAPPRNRASRNARGEDALPGVPYALDISFIDCLQIDESLPLLDISMLQPGIDMNVIVGEVYSPSHIWLIRVGPNHELAMEEIIHEMTEYFERGEGRQRYLARAAIRVGQYCTTFYERTWHRAIIIDLIDGEHLVKVRLVDYGSVGTVSTSTLRPFLRRWAGLPRQAMRARLAGVRPAGGARRWSHAASEYFLRLVDDRSLIASIVAINIEESTLEVFLVDTRREDDDGIARDLVRAGFADVRRDSALRANESYLYPMFSALENGATPNLDEIKRYLHDGITLEYVPAYRRHVPGARTVFAPTAGPRPAPLVLRGLLAHMPIQQPVPRHYAARALPTVTPSSGPTATHAPRLTGSPKSRPTGTSKAILAGTSAPRPTVTQTLIPTAPPVPRPIATTQSITTPRAGPMTTPMSRLPTTTTPRHPAPTAPTAPNYIFSSPGVSFNLPAMPQPYGMQPPPYGITPPPYGLPSPPPHGIPQLSYGTNAPPSLMPHGVLSPPFGMAMPPFGMPGYGVDAAVGGELLMSAAGDWAMYEQLTATAYWFKLEAMRRARLAAASVPPSTSHHHFTSDPTPRL